MAKDSSTRFWLMKTEPDVFSFKMLVDSPKQTAPWEGVRNYQARNFMRDEFAVGQQVFIYHSSCDEPSIVGIAEVVKAAYADPSALNKKSPYFDEKSAKDGASRWVMVDVKAVKQMSTPVSIAALRKVAEVNGMALLQKGQRLSIQPVEKKHWDTVVKLGKPKDI